MKTKYLINLLDSSIILKHNFIHNIKNVIGFLERTRDDESPKL